MLLRAGARCSIASNSSGQPALVVLELEARLLGEVDPHQQPGALAMEVEAVREVDGHRQDRGQAAHRLGDEHLTAQRGDVELEAHHLAHGSRPGPGRADDRSGLDASSRCRHGADLAVLDLDPLDRASGHERRSVTACRARVALHGRLGGCMPVEPTERTRQHVVEADQRIQLADLVGRQEPARHSEPVLQLDALLEGRDVLGRRQREQVADLVQIDLPAGTLAEVHERIDAAHRDADVELVGELRSHPARRPRRRAGRECVALEKQHVAHARLREVEGDARPHHTASDDHDLRPLGQRSAHEPLVAVVSSAWLPDGSTASTPASTSSSSCPAARICAPTRSSSEASGSTIV